MRSGIGAPWGIAQSWCEQNDMTLPNPTNKAQNDLYTAAGPTWMDINVNNILTGKHNSTIGFR